MGGRINIPNKTQEARILEALKQAAENNNGWVNGQYFLRSMMISQYHRAIHNLENRYHVSIEHSTFKDEFGFLSYRLVGTSKAAAMQKTTPSKEWVFESETMPGKKHHVIDFTTALVCDCIGYTYRKTCKHIESVKETLKTQAKPIQQLAL